MKNISLLFKASFVLLVLCLICFFFVRSGTPEFVAVLLATGVNVIVLAVCVILIFTRRKK